MLGGPLATITEIGHQLVTHGPSDSERSTAGLLNVVATWDNQDLPLRQHVQAVARSLTR